MPVSEGLDEFSSDQPQVGRLDGNLVNDIASRLTEVLIVQHEQKATSFTGECSNCNDVSNGVRCNDCEESTGMRENFVQRKMWLDLQHFHALIREKACYLLCLMGTQILLMIQFLKTCCWIMFSLITVHICVRYLYLALQSLSLP